MTTKIASGADLILTMTREHCDIALETAPRQLRRTFTLAQAARLVTEFAPATGSLIQHNHPTIHQTASLCGDSFGNQLTRSSDASLFNQASPHAGLVGEAANAVASSS